MVVTEEIQNAALDAALALLNGGDLLFREGGTTRVTFSLQNPAFAAASGGEADLDVSAPMTASATSSATAELDNYQFRTSGGLVRMSGSISGLAGAGEFKMNHPNVELNDVVTVTGFTVSIPTGA